MTKRQYSYMLRNEIARINKKIDDKIILGYAYERDARRHRELLAAMKRVENRSGIVSWLKSRFAFSIRSFRPGFTLF